VTADDKPLRPDPFRQLEEILPTPNDQRTASGAPGHRYWQQRADYQIDVSLDEVARHIRGSERVTYHNRSPDTLSYLWVQLDANIFSPVSHSVQSNLAPDLTSAPSFDTVERWLARRDFDGGCTLGAIRGADGAPLAHTVVDTMMRLDLPKPLAAGASTIFSIEWAYDINDASKVGGRTGYEYFEDDKNCIFEIAQWFPRMAAYTDVNGWQHKQFLGAGEFTLEFGDYDVRIDVPADHVVAATGVLQNADAVLSAAQRERLKQAETAERPVQIVTLDEAKENEKETTTARRTWNFHAENVRDFGWASSRKFLWDAVLVQQHGHPVWAMSFYPKEGEPLWSHFSTQSILHTLDVYSRHSFYFPYPVAQSINGPVGGMEYPMICFNGPRPEKDGTYSSGSKYGLISVVIHEVGHNYFPMVVNSDERQWTWMDEGLNTFLQFLAEQEWEERYPSSRGEPRNITNYMKSTDQVPIMTASDSLIQFGANAYSKPATALNVLRETVLGRENFDFAFRTYAQRWEFKRPEPADFFRTMEDASGVDLDWFWRGWFYGTKACDLAIDRLRVYTLSTQDPSVEKERQRRARDARPQSLTESRNDKSRHRVDDYPELADFYNQYDDLAVTPADLERYDGLLAKLDAPEKALLGSHLRFYVVDFENIGGLVMPIPVQIDYTDGTREDLALPAEIWRTQSDKVSKLVITDREIAKLTIDAHGQIADSDVSNNVWPRQVEEQRLDLRKDSRDRGKNPMQLQAEQEKKDREKAAPTPASAPAQGQ
jgi:hypothetical protein